MLSALQTARTALKCRVQQSIVCGPDIHEARCEPGNSDAGRKTKFAPGKSTENFHENTGFTLTLLEKDPQNSNSEESSENRETSLHVYT